MNTKRIALTILLADFLAMSAWAVYQIPNPMDWIPLATANWVTIQIGLDLVVACGIGVGWMWADARKRGIQPLGYALLTVCTGSVGLLTYLIRREWSPTTSAPQRAAA